MFAVQDKHFENWVFDDALQVKTLMTPFNELDFAEETRKWRAIFPADQSLCICSILVPIHPNQFSQIIALRLNNETARVLQQMLQQANFESPIAITHHGKNYYLPFNPTGNVNALMATASYTSYTALYHLIQQQVGFPAYRLDDIKSNKQRDSLTYSFDN